LHADARRVCVAYRVCAGNGLGLMSIEVIVGKKMKML